MSLFGTISGIFRGKARELDNELEDKNRVLLAENEIEDMKKQLATHKDGVKKVKAELIGIERELEAETEEFESDKAKAKLLMEKGTEKATELAKEKAEVCIERQGRIKTLTENKVAKENQLKSFEKIIRKFESSVQASTRQLKDMKSNERQLNAMKSITNLDMDGSKNALSRFKDAADRQQIEMDEANAAIEMQSGSNLDDAIAEELGDTSTDDFLSSL